MAVLLDNVAFSEYHPRTPTSITAELPHKHMRSNHRRRPRRPPFLLVESEGVGVTSSILPIFMPERASARRADCAPGPGVLVPLPATSLVRLHHKLMFVTVHTTSSSNLHMQSRNTQLLAPCRNILCRQHSSIGRGLIAIGFDFHAASHTADGFAAAGITQVSL